MEAHLANKYWWVDILVLLLLSLVAVIVTEVFYTKTLVSATMFFVIPSLYLFLRSKPASWIKIFAAALILGIACSAVGAAITANSGWWIPDSQLVFPQRFFNIWNIDDTLWYVGMIFYVVTFYEYFLNTQQSKKFSSNFCYFLLLPVITSGVLVVFAVMLPTLLRHVPYAYLTLASPFVIGPIIFLFFIQAKVPVALFRKFLLTVPFFIIVNLTHEVTALRTGQLIYPGQYLGTIHLVGVSIPIEEFVMYIILSPIFVLAYYEIFVNKSTQ